MEQTCNGDTGGGLASLRGFKRVDAEPHKPVREHPLTHLSSFEMNDQYRHPENSAPPGHARTT